MIIQPVKTENVPAPPKTRPQPAPGAKPESQPPEQEKVGRKERLMKALERQPSVRPEVIERAKLLAADPDYPSADVLAKVAEKFVAAEKRSK